MYYTSLLVVLGAALWTVSALPSPDINVIIGSETGNKNTGQGASAKVHNVDVGINNLLQFSPASITADVGDQVQFTFHGFNHSISQSSLDGPCTEQYGFRTGFGQFNPDEKTILTSFTLNTLDPQYFFCHQTLPVSHCQAGMVFAINPGVTMPVFLQNALNYNDSSNDTTMVWSTLSTKFPVESLGGGSAATGNPSQSASSSSPLSNTVAKSTAQSVSITISSQAKSISASAVVNVPSQTQTGASNLELSSAGDTAASVDITGLVSAVQATVSNPAASIATKRSDGTESVDSCTIVAAALPTVPTGLSSSVASSSDGSSSVASSSATSSATSPASSFVTASSTTSSLVASSVSNPANAVVEASTMSSASAVIIKSSSTAVVAPLADSQKINSAGKQVSASISKYRSTIAFVTIALSVFLL